MRHLPRRPALGNWHKRRLPTEATAPNWRTCPELAQVTVAEAGAGDLLVDAYCVVAESPPNLATAPFSVHNPANQARLAARALPR